MESDHIRRLRGCFDVGSGAGSSERSCEAYGCVEPVDELGPDGERVDSDHCARHGMLLRWMRDWLDQPAVGYIDDGDQAENPDDPIDFRAEDSFDVARAGWRVTARDGDGRVPPGIR